jgi:hypothetical protein
VLQPDVIEVFQCAGISYKQPLGVVAHERYYLNRDGSIAQRMAMRQVLTSWNLLYSSMREPAQLAYGNQLLEQAMILPRFGQWQLAQLILDDGLPNRNNTQVYLVI